MSAEPGEREPAPEPIRIVQTFINSNDLEGADQLETPDALRAWLDANGLEAPARVSAAGLERAIGLREALRELVSANAGLPYDDAARAVVDGAARRAGLQPVLPGPAASVLEPDAA